MSVSKTNEITQIIIVVGSAILMFVASYIGKLQANKDNYNPALIPTLNLVAAAFLLNMLISNEFEQIVNNFNWLFGIITLGVLILCNYLSPEQTTSLTLKIESKDSNESDLKNILKVWDRNVREQDLILYFGEDTVYQNAVIEYLRKELSDGILLNKTITAGIKYNVAENEGTNANNLRIIKFIKQVLGSKYVVTANINDTGGISFGLAGAILVNFVMDGLLVGNEIKYSNSEKATIRKGYMKLNNIFGFIFDNLILMLILGFNFTQSTLPYSKQALYLLLIIFAFAISMFLGMFTSISSNINKSIANTIVFVVIAYTILVELMPESTVFRDYYGRIIETEDKEDPYIFVNKSWYLMNYNKAIMPIILFSVFFLYKKFTGLLE